MNTALILPEPGLASAIVRYDLVANLGVSQCLLEALTKCSMTMEALQNSSHGRGNEAEPIKWSSQESRTGPEPVVCGFVGQVVLLPDVEATVAVGVAEATRDDRQAAASDGDFGLFPEQRMFNQSPGVVGQSLESVISKPLPENDTIGFDERQQDLRVVVVEQRERSDS